MQLLNKSLRKAFSSNQYAVHQARWFVCLSIKNVGVKIRHVRCNSPLRLLGIRRGDVIVAINGKKIKDYPSALIAFYKLKHSKKLRVLIKRKNKKVRLQYRLIG